jgi:hypothetical protein
MLDLALLHYLLFTQTKLDLLQVPLLLLAQPVFCFPLLARLFVTRLPLAFFVKYPAFACHFLGSILIFACANCLRQPLALGRFESLGLQLRSIAVFAERLRLVLPRRRCFAILTALLRARRFLLLPDAFIIRQLIRQLGLLLFLMQDVFAYLLKSVIQAGQLQLGADVCQTAGENLFILQLAQIVQIGIQRIPQAGFRASAQKPIIFLQPRPQTPNALCKTGERRQRLRRLRIA